MRLPFYRTAARREALLNEARSWLDTPFRENSAVKGKQGGVECRHFLHECHVVGGATERIEIPVKPVEVVRHWHEHHAVSLMMDWLNDPSIVGGLCGSMKRMRRWWVTSRLIKNETGGPSRRAVVWSRGASRGDPGGYRGALDA